MSALDRLLCQALFNPYIISIVFELVASSGSMQASYSNAQVEPSELFSIQVPSSFVNKQYKDLFQYLMSKRGILALGLYRNRPTDDISPMPYIVTSPPHDMQLNAEDQIYSLISPLLPSSAPTGTLHVTVLEAVFPHEKGRDLSSGGIICIVRCQGEQNVSDVCSNRQDPHFNLQSSFLLIEGEGLLQIRIVNQLIDPKSQVAALPFNIISTDNPLATLELPISDFVDKSNSKDVRDKWYNLTEEASAVNARRRAKLPGERENSTQDIPRIRLQIVWKPAIPASDPEAHLQRDPS
jgi:hypothetical protein